MHNHTAAVVLAIVSCSASAQFVGDYAPDLWQPLAGSFNSSSTFVEVSESRLRIVGFDGAANNITRGVEAVASSDSTITLDWAYSSRDAFDTFDYAFYEIDGFRTVIAYNGDTPSLFDPATGQLTLEVLSGQKLAFGVFSEDGEDGPGILEITNFSASADPASLADLNGDGILMLDDINLFIRCFLTHDPRADINRDGLIDISDLQDFVAAYLG